MQTQSDSHALAPTLQATATALRLTGLISFWLQLGFIVISGVVLLFAVSGRNFSTQPTPWLGIGVFWAVCGLLALCFNVYLAFRYARIGRRLRNQNPELRPRKVDTLRLLRLGVVVGFVGMLLSILGAGATVGVLVAKSISQPPGVAITDPNRIIRALDVFVMVANLNNITAHFVGATTSLGLFDRLYRH